MQAVLIVNVNSAREENCGSQVVQVLKLSSLVLLTYGLMVAMFALSLAFERVETPISSGYKDGGGILLGLFILEVTMWGIAWCWGAGKREALRRSIVDRQLAQIRAMEQAEEERDLAEEKRMIEERRHMMNR